VLRGTALIDSSVAYFDVQNENSLCLCHLMLIFISNKQLDNELKISIKKVSMNHIIFGTTKVANDFCDSGWYN